MVKMIPCVILIAVHSVAAAHAQHAFDDRPPASDAAEQGETSETTNEPRPPPSTPNWVNWVVILLILYLGSPLSRPYTRTIPIVGDIIDVFYLLHPIHWFSTGQENAQVEQVDEEKGNGASATQE